MNVPSVVNIPTPPNTLLRVPLQENKEQKPQNDNSTIQSKKNTSPLSIFGNIEQKLKSLPATIFPYGDNAISQDLHKIISEDVQHRLFNLHEKFDIKIDAIEKYKELSHIFFVVKVPPWYTPQIFNDFMPAEHINWEKLLKKIYPDIIPPIITSSSRYDFNTKDSNNINREFLQPAEKGMQIHSVEIEAGYRSNIQEWIGFVVFDVNRGVGYGLIVGKSP